MESIVCNGIGKIYGKKQVLKNINLTLEKGKIYGLIGRNGAGKTTLLSIMSAQNPASEGTVTWNGENVWENRKALDHICFSRELSINLYGSGVSGMKVKDYLKTASYYYPNWDQALAEELIKKFELNTKQRINKMSKGMLSMVTIIVALASKADFTFMDEPVAGLDVVMRDYFYHKLMEEYTETGRTFVISTHIIEEATDLMEEVVMIKNGEVLLKENTQELLERSYHVSGLAEVVDQATEGYERHHEEKMGSSRVFGDFWKTAYFYGGIISVLFAMIGPVSYVGSYLPLTLSFGSGRREAVFGAQIFCVVYVVSAYIILVFAGIMSSGKFNGKLNALIAVLFIFMTAIGQLVSVAQMHFGMKGMIIGIVMVVLGIVIGIVAGIGFIDQIMAWINRIQTNVVWTLLAIAAIVSIALYAVSVMALFREMRHYEVKA